MLVAAQILSGKIHKELYLQLFLENEITLRTMERRFGFYSKHTCTRPSLVVQWQRLQAPNAGG